MKIIWLLSFVNNVKTKVPVNCPNSVKLKFSFFWDRLTYWTDNSSWSSFVLAFNIISKMLIRCQSIPVLIFKLNYTRFNSSSTYQHSIENEITILIKSPETTLRWAGAATDRKIFLGLILRHFQKICEEKGGGGWRINGFGQFSLLSSWKGWRMNLTSER